MKSAKKRARIRQKAGGDGFEPAFEPSGIDYRDRFVSRESQVADETA